MPPLEVYDTRYGKAVLWRASSVDKYGRPIHDEPEEINARWIQNKSRDQTSDGESIILDATVTLDEELPIGSLMWEGTLEAWQDNYYGTGSIGDPADYISEQGLHVIKTMRKVPSIKGARGGTAIRYSAGLQRFRHDVTE